MTEKSKKATKKATKRRRFQVISIPAPGETSRAPRIAYTSDNPRVAVETARWGAFNNPRSGRRYRVRDRKEKIILFEIDSNRCSFDVLCGVLYDGWQNLAPGKLDETFAGEWLHEDYYDGEGTPEPGTPPVASGAEAA